MALIVTDGSANKGDVVEATTAGVNETNVDYEGSGVIEGSDVSCSKRTALGGDVFAAMSVEEVALVNG